MLGALFPALALLAPATSHIDREWFRQAVIGETAHWREAASTPSGFFQPALDRQWRPVGEQTGTLVSQCRLLFVKRHFIDAGYGGWYGSYDPKIPTEGRRAYNGSIWMVGYHVCGMYAEAWRLSEGR